MTLGRAAGVWELSEWFHSQLQSLSSSSSSSLFQQRVVIVYYWTASQRGDHIERWSSSSHPSWAALQEERRPGEGGDSGGRSREERESDERQETHKKEQRKTRSQAQSKHCTWPADHNHAQINQNNDVCSCRKAQRMTKKQMPTQQWRTDQEKASLFSPQRACSLARRCLIEFSSYHHRRLRLLWFKLTLRLLFISCPSQRVKSAKLEPSKWRESSIPQTQRLIWKKESVSSLLYRIAGYSVVYRLCIDLMIYDITKQVTLSRRPEEKIFWRPLKSWENPRDPWKSHQVRV